MSSSQHRAFAVLVLVPLVLTVLRYASADAPDPVRVGGLSESLNQTEDFTGQAPGLSCGEISIDWQVDNGAKIIWADGEEVTPPSGSISDKKHIRVRYDQASSTQNRGGSVTVTAKYPSGEAEQQTRRLYRTVVKCEIAIANSVSDDNARKADWLTWNWPNSSKTLGHLVKWHYSTDTTEYAVQGCGYEARGQITPNDFGGQVVLKRKVRGTGFTYSDTDQGSTQRATKSGDDNSPAGWLDTAGPNVYDIDTPGHWCLTAIIDSQFVVERQRINFTEYAWWTPTSRQCSLDKDFKVAFSYRHKAAADGTRTWQLATAVLCSTTTIGNNRRNWAANCWQNGRVKITHNKGAGQIRKVVSNTATTLTVTPAWDPPPDGTSWFAVEHSGWELETTYNGNGDNCGAVDGTLNKLTWNMQ